MHDIMCLRSCSNLLPSLRHLCPSHNDELPNQTDGLDELFCRGLLSLQAPGHAVPISKYDSAKMSAVAAAVPAASERVPHCATTAASDVALAQATAKPFAPVDGSLAPLAAREDRALESSAHVPALEDAPADELDEVMLKVRLNEAELLHAVFLYELATHEAEESARALDASESAASAADARLHPA